MIREDEIRMIERRRLEALHLGLLGPGGGLDVSAAEAYQLLHDDLPRLIDELRTAGRVAPPAAHPTLSL